MKYVCVTVLFLLFTSCDYLNVKKTSSEDILKEELESFNWNELDVYPTFSVCDTTSAKAEKKQCFEEELTGFLTHFLARQKFVVDQDVSDTLQITFLISDTGETSISDIVIKEETLLQLPRIKDILHRSLDSLPEIYPAIKRGQQVTSQFIMPVVISVN